MINQEFKRGSKWRTDSPVYLILYLVQQFQVANRGTSPDMATRLYTCAYGSFKKIQSNLRRKKLHRTNQGSNLLGSSSSNRDDVRSPIQFRKKIQPKHLKKLIFLKNRPIHFHINITDVIRKVIEVGKVQDQKWSLGELQHRLDILMKTSNPEPLEAIYY